MLTTVKTLDHRLILVWSEQRYSDEVELIDSNTHVGRLHVLLSTRYSNTYWCTLKDL